MNIKPLQQNFAAGEISSRFLCRIELEAYRAGVAEMLNMFPLSQGPVTSRFGTQYQTDVLGNEGRLFAFPVDDFKGYVIAIGNQEQIVVWDPIGETVKATFTSADGVANYGNNAWKINVEISPAGTEMYIFCIDAQTRVINYNRSTDVFTHAVVDWTGQTNSQFKPGCGFYFEGRLWVGAFDGSGTYGANAFLASASGTSTNMTINASPGPADALSFTMSRYSRVRWISGLRQLMVGTDRGEFVVESVDNDVISAGNIRVRQQSQHGSKLLEPASVGNNILFVSPDGRKLRDTGYRWTEDAWVARDLTYVSEHITQIGLIKEVHWAPDPENLLYCPLDSGHLLIAIYEWNNNVVGWARAETNGDYISSCVLTYAGTSYAFFLTKRAFEGGTKMRLEIEGYDHYLDCAKREYGNGNQINEAFHLQGQTVQVVTNDDQAWHPDVVISDGGPQGPTNPDNLPAGHANLVRSVDNVIYGYAYPRRLVTMPLDLMIQSGSATATQKRRYRIRVRTKDSVPPIINGNVPADRTPSTPMGTREPTRPYEDHQAHDLGWDVYAPVVVEQPKPVPLTILGIFGDAALESL